MHEQSYLRSPYHDLISPDGKITHIDKGESKCIATVEFQDIGPNFLGFTLPENHIEFNLKSVLAQLGIESHLLDLELDAKYLKCTALVKLFSINAL